MSERTAKITADETLIRFISRSEELVDRLPEWKRGVLQNIPMASQACPRESRLPTDGKLPFRDARIPEDR